MTEIRMLSLWQPWASLIAMNVKQYETRSWWTGYRGKLAIHAAMRPPKRSEWKHLWNSVAELRPHQASIHLFKLGLESKSIPLGGIVAICDLVGCYRMEHTETWSFSTQHPQDGRICIEHQSSLENLVGDWSLGRYAWELKNIKAVEPLKYRGLQGLTRLPDDVASTLLERSLAA
jgi:hypothetical protein